MYSNVCSTCCLQVTLADISFSGVSLTCLPGQALCQQTNTTVLANTYIKQTTYQVNKQTCWRLTCDHSGKAYIHSDKVHTQSVSQVAVSTPRQSPTTLVTTPLTPHTQVSQVSHHLFTHRQPAPGVGVRVSAARRVHTQLSTQGGRREVAIPEARCDKSCPPDTHTLPQVGGD